MQKGLNAGECKKSGKAPRFKLHSLVSSGMCSEKGLHPLHNLGLKETNLARG